jgi:hypothetical protein
MSSLYDIRGAHFALLRELQDLDGELSPEMEARLTAIECAHDEKLEACCCVLKNFGAWVELHKAEIDRLAERKRLLEARMERLKLWVSGSVPAEGWERGVHKLSWRKSKSVEVEDAEKLPLEMTRVKLEADKTALKKALESGATFEGREARRKTESSD